MNEQKRENIFTNLFNSKQVASVGVNVEISNDSLYKLALCGCAIVLVAGVIYSIVKK